jgi:hypothetical protein
MEAKTQNLDPQLKAAYERVMGTTVSPQASAQAAAPAAQIVTPASSKNNGDAKVVAGGAKSGGLSPILIGIAAILFFAIYTIVWLKVFKITVPFLPF